MARYIDADELLKVLEVFSNKEGEKADFFAHKNLDDLSTKYNHGQYCYENAKEIVNTMPTANVEEVRHGYWMHSVEFGFAAKYHFWNCSLCGVASEDEGNEKYCRECGAKMDGKDDSNE